MYAPRGLPPPPRLRRRVRSTWRACPRDRRYCRVTRRARRRRRTSARPTGSRPVARSSPDPSSGGRPARADDGRSRTDQRELPPNLTAWEIRAMDVTVEAGWLGAQLREVECRARWRAGSAGRKARLPGAPTEWDGHDNGTGNADRRLMDVPRDGAGRQVAHGEGERDVTGARVDGHCDGAVAALALGGVSFAPDNVVVSWQPPGGRLARRRSSRVDPGAARRP